MSESKIKNYKQLKIALAHDWLDEVLGGSERVFIEFTKLFPNAPIYTLLFDESRYKGIIDAKRVTTSGLQKLPKFLRRRHKFLLPFIPKAVERLDLSGFDVVLSSSNGFIKGLETTGNTKHICYLHTPARFAWEDAAKYLNKNTNLLTRGIAKWLNSRFRAWDIRSARRVDKWLANSLYTAERIKKYYHAEATVINPPVNVMELKNYIEEQKDNYFITLSTFAGYKRLDLVVEAFNLNGRPLIMVGEGPEKAKLQKISKANIQFRGWVEEAAKAKLLANAKALIYPSTEDFGIAPIEAMAVGTPVIAYGAGGVLETITEGKGGLFFNRPTVKSLNQSLQKFDKLQWIPKQIHESVAKYDKSNFLKAIKDTLALAQFKQVKILGLEVDNQPVKDSIEIVVSHAQSKKSQPYYILQPHVEFLHRALTDRTYLEFFTAAKYRFPNGVPLGWARYYLRHKKANLWGLFTSLLTVINKSQTIRQELPYIYNSSTFTLPLLEAAAKRGLKISLIGSPKYRDISYTAEYIRKKIPGINIVGKISGRSGRSFKNLKQLKRELAEHLEIYQPDIILVGLGTPLQEKLMNYAISVARHGVFIGEGGTFDYRSFGGRKRRAPKIVQKIGLEWAWRMLLEPSRIRRQLAIPKFIWFVYRFSKN